MQPTVTDEQADALLMDYLILALEDEPPEPEFRMIAWRLPVRKRKQEAYPDHFQKRVLIDALGKTKETTQGAY